ncbi:MAG: putative sulfate/molybdate transporter [Euryarchaeota archaeon]|nr:putative sulfate/molybdate transporter [Euryarchaeota archaeon]MBU4221940.1 putative sulfate/molybdate transporter [Euryarchaeota archaeon]MCG2736237.1 putative sulfate/molybdate transporter [Candidatus Methanoperedenaceae archaeon]
MKPIDRLRSLFLEASGALGDLGTFLPYVIGAISINHLSPSSVFSTFGLFYVSSGLFYRMPMAVQPMKAASAYALSYELTPDAIAAASVAIGVILVVLWATGAIKWLVKHTPGSVSIGIQTGLGISLALLGIKFIMQQPLLGLILLVMMFLIFQNSRFPAAIIALILGILSGYATGLINGFPAIVPGFYLPEIKLPVIADLFSANILTFIMIQIPLTLTNAVIATSALSSKLYPSHKRVTAGNLSLSMGIANLFSGTLGGMPMCHGSGGVAAHYKFGARHAIAPVMLGTFFLFTGLFFGESGLELLKIIPGAVLGCLLFYSGFELAGVFKDAKKKEMSVVVIVAVISIATNPALGFVLGILVNYGVNIDKFRRY